MLGNIFASELYLNTKKIFDCNMKQRNKIKRKGSRQETAHSTITKRKLQGKSDFKIHKTRRT